MNAFLILGSDPSGFTLIESDGQVYRVPTESLGTLDTRGFPMAARWECTFSQFQRFRETVFDNVR